MTAKQRVYKYFVEFREYPSLETWKDWGYNRQYYYEVKKKWANGENFNEPDDKLTKMQLEGIKSIANKDGVIAITKSKDMNHLKDWLVKIKEDENFNYYVVKW